MAQPRTDTKEKVCWFYCDKISKDWRCGHKETQGIRESSTHGVDVHGE